ncbi:Arc family DNA-binding protein [Micrococcales bacterium 31B]|nr:Arc family DNA-binding protein [Micrococcales bacterium 31B]
MSSIVVRGLAPGVKEAIAARAQENGRSMEAEVREILTRAAGRPHIGLALLQAARAVGGCDELQVAPRTDPARSVDFG